MICRLHCSYRWNQRDNILRRRAYHLHQELTFDFIDESVHDSVDETERLDYLLICCSSLTAEESFIVTEEFVRNYRNVRCYRNSISSTFAKNVRKTFYVRNCEQRLKKIWQNETVAPREENFKSFESDSTEQNVWHNFKFPVKRLIYFSKIFIFSELLRRRNHKKNRTCFSKSRLFLLITKMIQILS